MCVHGGISVATVVMILLVVLFVALRLPLVMEVGDPFFLIYR